MSARVPLYGEVGVREEQEPDARVDDPGNSTVALPHRRHWALRALVPYTATCVECGARFCLAFAWTAVACWKCGRKVEANQIGK